jgi:hypothetical protein
MIRREIREAKPCGLGIECFDKNIFSAISVSAVIPVEDDPV